MNKWKITYYLGIAITVLAILGIAYYEFASYKKQLELDQLRTVVVNDDDVDMNVVLETVPYPNGTVETVIVNSDSGESETVIVDEGLINPIDFTTLWDTNYDIFAWIRVPGTVIDYPILHHAGSFEETDYYLRRDYQGYQSSAGSIYTQYYYNQDFDTDNLTVIYGHNMRNNTMFGSLSEYNTDEIYRSDNNMIYIYTPYHSYRYRIVGVLYRGSENIMYRYSGMYIDVGQGEFSDFVSDFNDGTFGNGWIEDGFTARNSDHFIVLSTCTGNSSQRLVIVAVREESL